MIAGDVLEFVECWGCGRRGTLQYDDEEGMYICSQCGHEMDEDNIIEDLDEKGYNPEYVEEDEDERDEENNDGGLNGSVMDEIAEEMCD